MTQYEPWVIRETLHNCIAHQDYLLAGRINVVEEPASLLFTNVGDFMPGTVEEVIMRDAPPELYRNRVPGRSDGEPEHDRHHRQRHQTDVHDTTADGSFPMPDYDLSDPGRVKVRLIGKVIDENYTRMLIEKADLDLSGRDRLGQGAEEAIPIGRRSSGR